MPLTYVGAGTVPSSGATPGIENWKSFVMPRWEGGQDLGTFAVRNKHGGTSLSVHAVGRAWDWRYADPGPGRAAADEAIAFAVDHYELVGIQAVHDYVNCRIWRCSRSGTGPGWKQQRPDDQMGQPWAAWLHWEVHPDAAVHTRIVPQLLGDAPVVPSTPAEAAALPSPTLELGDQGPAVAQLQSVLNVWLHCGLVCDGRFGRRTESAVKAWQTTLLPFNGGRADGRYGPRTYTAAVASYGALTKGKAA